MAVDIDQGSLAWHSAAGQAPRHCSVSYCCKKIARAFVIAQFRAARCAVRSCARACVRARVRACVRAWGGGCVRVPALACARACVPATYCARRVIAHFRGSTRRNSTTNRSVTLSAAAAGCLHVSMVGNANTPTAKGATLTKADI
jgi:hypothetical protein